MIEIEAPDGSIVEFPDGMPDAAISAAMAKAFGGPKPTSAPAVSAPEESSERGTLSNIGGGFYQGVGDVGASLIRGGDFVASTMLGYSPYERIHGEAPKAAIQRANERFEDEYGDSWAATGGRIGGQLAATLPVTGGISAGLGAAGRAVPAIQPVTQFLAGTGGNLASRMAQGAILGGTASGLAIGGSSDEPGKDIAIGAGIGAALPVVGVASRAVGRKAGDAFGRAVSGSAQRKAANEFIRNTPDTEALKQVAHRVYSQAEQLGVVIKPEPYQQAVSKIATAAQQEGINPTLHPKAVAALAELQRAAEKPLSLNEAETLRKIVNAAARSVDPDERRVAYVLVNGLDDFIGNLKPQDTIAGGQNATAAGEILSNARALWSRAKKSELIDWAFTRAKDQPSGIENGLRIQFRQILGNKQLRRTFSPSEIEAMEKVVRGTFTSNTLRRLGRFSMGSGQQGSTLAWTMGSGLGAGVGAAVGGPVGAAVGAP
jgi:hypothetical protein